MPMPYLRFPEGGSFQDRFYSLPPRHPACGFISLETGSKIYAWVNMFLYAFGVALMTVCFFIMIIGSSHQPSNHELVQNLLQGNFTSPHEQDDWVEKMHLKQSYVLIIIIIIFAHVTCCYLLSVFWKLKKAIDERDVPTLKKKFIVILLASIVFFVFNITETEYLWSKSILFELPWLLFDFAGLLFTYYFIISLIHPDCRQNEDTNRIHFNV